MNKPPFFSVVIPTYNCAELLNRSLSSVFSQTYQDFEIIVIDNSSTDNTQKVLKNISNQKLKVIRVNNKGFCNTYNELDGPLKKVGYSVVERNIEIPGKLFRIFGVLSYKKPFYYLFRLLTRVILRHRVSFFYILVKK